MSLPIFDQNQEVSILRVFDPFQFRPLWNSCSIFFYILYIGYDKYLCEHLIVYICVFTNKQTVYDTKIYI